MGPMFSFLIDTAMRRHDCNFYDLNRICIACWIKARQAELPASIYREILLKFGKVMEKMEEDDEFYSLLKLNSYVEMLPLLPQEHSKDYFLLERQFVSKLTDKLQNHHPIDTPEEVAHSEWLLGIIE
jgi:hypothetical protein